MNTPSSSLLLLGVGGAGGAVARGISRAFGEGLRYLIVDTDAKSGEMSDPFVLLGGDRLSGRGAGGDLTAARTAAEESIDLLNERLEGVRLAVIVTGLGGGTGGGVTIEILRHLAERNIATIVFATLPFAFEGEDRQRTARGATSLIEDAAGAVFFLPLDKLVGTATELEAGLRHAVDTLASGVTLFWRLLEKPGYLRFDAERLRKLVSGCGRGRFATLSAMGPGRAAELAAAIVGNELLTTGSGPVRSILLGVLAGSDLRLAELGELADSIRNAYGKDATFDLATVNDDDTFAGRLSVVAMMFEQPATAAVAPGQRRRRASRKAPAQRTGRFANSSPTFWNGEDIDVPTYLRQGLTLEF